MERKRETGQRSSGAGARKSNQSIRGLKDQSKGSEEESEGIATDERVLVHQKSYPIHIETARLSCRNPQGAYPACPFQSIPVGSGQSFRNSLV